ncbi:MAG: PAS domain S-box protein [Acidobacteria bacterium]|nr:PAS domain S-box protein [Acidobacteriota bacterium]
MSLSAAEPKKKSRFSLFLRPRLWIWTNIVLAFVICGSIFWVQWRQRDIYARTVAALKNVHEAHNELNRGMLFASLANDPLMPYDQRQGIVLLEQDVESLEDALRISSRDRLASSPETLEALRRYRASIEELKKNFEDWDRNKDDSPKRKTEIRVAFFKLEKEAEQLENAVEANLDRLSYRLNLEFGVVYLLGFLLLAGSGAAVVISQKAEQRSRDTIREAKSQLEQVVRATNVGLWDWNVRTGRIFYSPEWKAILGYRDDEIGDTIDEMKNRIHPDDLVDLTEQINRGLEAWISNRQFEFRLRHKDDSYRRVIASTSTIYENGEPVRVLAVNVDITDIKATEERLLRSEKRFQTLVEEAPESIFILTNEKFAYVNQTAVRLFGAQNKQELIGRPLLERVPDDRREAAARRIDDFRLHKNPLPLTEAEILKMDEAVVSVEFSAIPFEFHGQDGALFFIHETTERKQLEEELLQSKKMESIGRLAGGIAHDFNNLLTVIMAYSALAGKKVTGDAKLSSYIENIHTASEKASTLTGQLLAFARKQIITPQKLVINDEIRKVHGLVTRLIGEDVEVRLQLKDDLWTVKADPGQLEQIILNLAANARDAMPRGGILAIETDNARIDEPTAAHHQDILPGEYVMMVISDNGIGMEKSIQEHIFEPFFTTKETGRGTGLGLATCHGIVKQNGGHIWLNSEPGRGTTFRIYLPRVQEIETVAEPVEEEFGKATGTETILVVEDEPAVRGITVETLKIFGYRVVECESGHEALEKARSFDGQIDLLLTDVVMPQMSGKELAVEIRKVLPAIRILYVSGYTANTIGHHGVLEEEADFIAKPYHIDQLGAKIREILDK